jgi:multidrug efflux system outer membrane protein
MASTPAGPQRESCRRERNTASPARNTSPAVDYQAGWNRQRLDRILNPTGKSQTRWTVEAGFSWELDLWGRLRRLNEAALAQYLATEEARRGVMLSLVSDVAVAYLDLRELDQDLAIAKRTTEAFEGTYQLFRRRLDGGAASALETERAEASLANVAAQIPEIERAIVARENQINFLLGRNPQPIPREGPLPAPPPEVPAGLPSTLLERRPDIRQAEQLLVAANAGIGVAKADFFPRLSLTGFFGMVSPELGGPVRVAEQGVEHRAVARGSALPGVAGSSAATRPPMRDGTRPASPTRPRSSTPSARSRARSWTGPSSSRPRGQREREVAAYREAVRLANVRYGSGFSAYFEVLEAQQQLFPAEIALAQTRRDQLVAVVDLYRALGGGVAGRGARTRCRNQLTTNLGGRDEQHTNEQ